MTDPNPLLMNAEVEHMLKFCKDCIHIKYQSPNYRLGPSCLFSRYSSINLVHGVVDEVLEECSDYRRSELPGACGRDGKFFEKAENRDDE